VANLIFSISSISLKIFEVKLGRKGSTTVHMRIRNSHPVVRYDLLKLATQAKNAFFECPSLSEHIFSNFSAIHKCYGLFEPAYHAVQNGA